MIKEIISAALKSAGHYYDFDSNTLYMTPSFQKNSNTYGTNEYRMMNTILDQYPNARLEVFKSKRRDLLTYEMMEDFIRIMPNAAANFAEYKRIKLQSHAYRSSYKFVTEWFKAKFPHYGELLVKDADGKLTWSALENYDIARAEAATRAKSNTPAETAVA